MRIIAGLGNPGARYADTRHNIGFRVIDRLSADCRIPVARKSGDYEAGSGLAGECRILLVKPVTFMNQSGLAVRQVLNYFHETPSSLLVIHDDLDIPLGQVRVKADGGSGGHNGVASVIESVGTPEFLRIRIGIGRPLRKAEVVSFVLSPFEKGEEEIVEKAVIHAADAVREVLAEGVTQAMNRFNQKS